MTKHKSEDYKISAVKYYLKNNVSLDNVSKIFNFPKQSLYRWIDRYKKLKYYTVFYYNAGLDFSYDAIRCSRKKSIILVSL